uniref:Uncharacterized protein n=1 Tax=Cyprinus carpio carpio TaxID=630221 RepID=A0A9J8C6C5_CYPCA
LFDMLLQLGIETLELAQKKDDLKQHIQISSEQDICCFSIKERRWKPSLRRDKT